METITITENFDRDQTLDGNVKETVNNHFSFAEKIDFVNTFFIVQWERETEIYTIRSIVFDKGKFSITCTRQ